MKRILFFAALLAAAISLVSCVKEKQPSPSLGKGEYLKTVNVGIGTVTKGANTSNATVFIYKNNAKTGERSLYQKKYVAGSSFEVELLFSDEVIYTYDFSAYLNVGDLTSQWTEAEDFDIPLSASAASGQLNGVGESNSSLVTIEASLLVGKVQIRNITVDWNKNHGSYSQLTFVSMYLANVPDKFGGEPAINVGGILSDTPGCTYKEGLFFEGSRPFIFFDGQTINLGDSGFGFNPYVYGYQHEDIALIIVFSNVLGEKMYYSIPYNPLPNTHKIFDLTIRQNGASTPLGEYQQEAIEVKAVNFNVVDFENKSEETTFGESLPNINDPNLDFSGIAIYENSGDLYTKEQWIKSGKTIDDVVGIAVSDGTHGFVIHPTAERGDLMFSSNINYQPSGVVQTYDKTTAKKDFAGKTNTAAILASVSASNDAPAASYAATVGFNHGKDGYIPSAGEFYLIYTNLDMINGCLEAIGGLQVDAKKKTYWVSTQSSPYDNWAWGHNISDVYMVVKNSQFYVRPVAALY